MATASGTVIVAAPAGSATASGSVTVTVAGGAFTSGTVTVTQPPTYLQVYSGGVLKPVQLGRVKTDGTGIDWLSPGV